MSTLRSLVKDTAIYGLSSMFGRFLNWLLTYVYARVLMPEEMGQMTQLYSWTAVLLVLLTYGMETTFFRYVNKSERPMLVYGTSLIMVGASSLIFALAGLLGLSQISEWLGFSGEAGQLLVGALIIISALDAFCAIPLGYLRYAQRPWLFMAVRMGFVLFTIAATLCAFYLLPESLVGQTDKLAIILGINVLGCVLQLLMLLPSLGKAEWRFDARLSKEMLVYAMPILLLGLVGIFNTQADKLIFPRLLPTMEEGNIQLGIYATCYKIAVIMVLFTQAFRYAYDPFVFAQAKEGGEKAKEAYALSMRYYLLFTLFIFLGVMSTMSLLKHFITPAYYAGLPAVPLVMLGQLMFGIYFNLSLWYKLTDRTYWGAILSVLGAASSVLWIVLGAESMGFMACAWASLGSNALIMLISYMLGQRYYPINYPLKAMLGYSALALGLWGAEEAFAQALQPSEELALSFNLAMLALFTLVVVYKEGLLASAKQVLARRRKSEN